MGIFNIRNPVLLVLEPKLVKDILVKNFHHFHDNEFSDFINKDVDPLFGRNPFMLTGEEWKEKRAEVTPGFTPARVCFRNKNKEVLKNLFTRILQFTILL